MAELIDKCALLEKMKGTSRYFSVKFDIEEMPTISEYEIRAKAIEEFAERISVFGTYDYHGNKIDVLEIAEQLKEE